MGTALDTVVALREQLAAAEAAAAGEIAAAKKGTMQEVLDHLQENKITLSELTVFARIANSKYSDAAGNTYSGKGKKPEWYEKALAAGKKPEDLLTHKPA